MNQPDLFRPTASSGDVQRHDAKHAKWIRELEGTGDYKVMRRLVPRPPSAEIDIPGEKIGVVVDVETTGLDLVKDEIIELGMVAFSFDELGKVQRVLSTFSELR